MKDAESAIRARAAKLRSRLEDYRRRERELFEIGTKISSEANALLSMCDIAGIEDESAKKAGAEADEIREKVGVRAREVESVVGKALQAVEMLSKEAGPSGISGKAMVDGLMGDMTGPEIRGKEHFGFKGFGPDHPANRSRD